MALRRVLALGLSSALAALVPTASEARFQTGNRLLRTCQSMETTDISMCIGYIEGVQDADEHFAIWCVPPNTEAGQLQEVVIKALVENVAERAYPASGLVANAIAAAWPCPKPIPKPR